MTYIGDILIKDVLVTHRVRYMNYLRKEILPADTPIFDIKYKRANLSGTKVNILTVRCGKKQSTKLAEILSTALCGEGTHPEIFISRLAIGASLTSKRQHDEIYNVHNSFLEDVSHLLFSISTPIDVIATEYLASGKTLTRTPRQWAKSLAFPDGSPLETDLEDGGYIDSTFVLIVPSTALYFCERRASTILDAQESGTSKCY